MGYVALAAVITQSGELLRLAGIKTPTTIPVQIDHALPHHPTTKEGIRPL
jgi:hypothetical protein